MKKKAADKHAKPARKAPDPKPVKSVGLPPVGWLSLILTGGFLLYIPCLQYGFVFDDYELVQNNPVIRSLAAAWQQVIHPWAGYRPVRTLSYALDYAIGGLDPMIFHLSNLLIHLLVLLSIWLVLKNIITNRTVIWISLAAFALLPVHIDAVTYVSGRRDLLSALFSLLSFWAFLKFDQSRRPGWWLAIVGFFALAFFSKEMGIVVPIMILLYEWIREISRQPRGKAFHSVVSGLITTLRRGMVYYSLMFVLGGGLVIYKLVFQTVSGKIGWWGGSVVTNFLTVAKVLWYDLFAMLVPVTLRADYSYESFPVSYSPYDLLGLLALVTILVLIGWLFVQATRGRFQLSFWGLWIFAMLLPVAHFIPHHELLAEHYLYLPSLGFCVVLAVGLDALWPARRPIAVGIAVIVCCGWLAAAVVHQGVYRNNRTLFEDVVGKAPDCIRANLILGKLDLQDRNFSSAAERFRRVISVTPQNEREGIDLARFEEGDPGSGIVRGRYIHRQIGYYVEAYQKLMKTCRLMGQPEQAEKYGLQGAKKYPALNNDVGQLLAESGHYDRAIACFRKVIQSHHPNPLVLSSAWYNLGVAYLGQGDYGQARNSLQRTLTVKVPQRPPHLALAHYFLAIAMIKNGDEKKGIRRHLQAAVKLGLRGQELEQARRLLQNWHG